MKLCIVGILLSAGILVMNIMQYNKMTQSTLALFSILPVAGVVGYIMAWRNIRKDERLIKSLDKLR